MQPVGNNVSPESTDHNIFLSKEIFKVDILMTFLYKKKGTAYRRV